MLVFSSDVLVIFAASLLGDPTNALIICLSTFCIGIFDEHN
jgi:hypothetical protein